MVKIFDDLNVVLNEANFADETILKKHNFGVKSNNTVGIALTLNQVIKTQIDFLTKGIELELYAMHELGMVFNYLRYTY